MALVRSIFVHYFYFLSLLENVTFFAGIEPDARKAMQFYLKAAQNNFSDAFYEIGRRYEEGDGVTSDQQLAAQWYVFIVQFISVCLKVELSLSFAGIDALQILIIWFR
jgi:hypothetical protein